MHNRSFAACSKHAEYSYCRSPLARLRLTPHVATRRGKSEFLLSLLLRTLSSHPSHRALAFSLYFTASKQTTSYIMSHPGRLEGKTAIITGAGLGLGAGITRKFIAEGANVLLFEINKENGQKVADSLPMEKAQLFSGDVTEQDHWHDALKTCLERFGGCDIVVNNAGVVHRAGVRNPLPYPTASQRILLC